MQDGCGRTRGQLGNWTCFVCVARPHNILSCHQPLSRCWQRNCGTFSSGTDLQFRNWRTTGCRIKCLRLVENHQRKASGRSGPEKLIPAQPLGVADRARHKQMGSTRCRVSIARDLFNRSNNSLSSLTSRLDLESSLHRSRLVASELHDWQ